MDAKAPTIHVPTRVDGVTRALAIIAGLWAVFGLCHWATSPLGTLLRSHYPMHSEYYPTEQFSKFYLLVILLISFRAHRASNEPLTIKLGILFLVLSLVLYMGEGNMLTEKTHPIFGALIVPWGLMLLHRSRAWLSLVHFAAGFLCIGAGFLRDLLNDNEIAARLIPPWLLAVVRRLPEEYCEVIGVAFVLLSAILCFREPLRQIIPQHPRATAAMIGSTLVLAFGNGVMHYQYEPSFAVHSLGLAMSLCGAAGVILAHARSLGRRSIVTFVMKDPLCLLIVAFCIALPGVHGTPRSDMAVLAWLPFMILLAVGLWRDHPALATSCAASPRS